MVDRLSESQLAPHTNDVDAHSGSRECDSDHENWIGVLMLSLVIVLYLAVQLKQHTLRSRASVPRDL